MEGHRLRLEDLRDILAFAPDALVVGKGGYGLMKVGNDVKRELAERGIRLEAKKTSEACERYNKLVKEGKKVVAALHLTC